MQYREWSDGNSLQSVYKKEAKGRKLTLYKGWLKLSLPVLH
jgi:hypothetical protein